MADESETKGNDEYFAVRTGTWRDLIPRLPRPVLALGQKELYRVMFEGSGFTLFLDGVPKPIIGFFTTRYVAANNVREAQSAARSAVLNEWSRHGYRERTGAEPHLAIEEMEILEEWFRMRSGDGFAFFT